MSAVDPLESKFAEMIKACKADQLNFTQAAQCETNDELRELYAQFANQRVQFAFELIQAANAMGLTPPTLDELDERRHELNLNSPSLELYRKTLETELPMDLRDLVEGQLSQIEEAANHVRNLKNLKLI